ncbi:MAG: DUF4190 domain-containing protein [Nanoarchaeota archaeon]|nr:DUF4190 domain-containing protein [Nanoarchaeota archaeon]
MVDTESINSNTPVPPNGENSGEEIKSNLYGILSLIMGILALILAIVYIGLIFAILAIVFFFIQKKRQNNGLAIAGLVLGILGLIFSIIMIVFTIFVAVSMSNSLSNMDKISEMSAAEGMDYCIENDGDNIYSSAICYVSVVESNKNETIVISGDICLKIENEINQALCYITLENSFEDKKYCDYIKDINYKNECLKN